ncbi:CPBP family intramembrane glutamic endopeptidase [Neolewinella agarilytica]|uniref:CPBP family intramembrane glutamic endopeptidase n=1 Tax=Neolewinella agarilytica TaxID=478744 RepID=UPI00235503EB|nr:CPBP family intramembrane glutamic endopeptidase [Neolewinella agarilytica]
MKQTNVNSALPLRLFLTAIFFFILLLFAGSGLSAAIISLLGFSPYSTLDLPERQWFRLALFGNNLLTFSVSALLSFWWVYRQRWASAAGFTLKANDKSVPFGVSVFLLSLPLVAWLAWINLQAPLPDWAVRSEEQTNQFLRSILTMESVPELFLALLTAAVTPAIGEELLLRGLLQRRVLAPLLGNHHLAIWLAAFAFSFMHFEFAGFLPRLLLGATLGYAYHWSRSIWVPIVLHFLFNGMQVMIAYFSGGFTPDTEMEIVPPWWLALASLVAILYIGWKAEQLYGRAEARQETA